MRAARLLIVLTGLAVAGYGGWLWWSGPDGTLFWLLGGPVLHDLLVAPVVGGTGLLLGRLVGGRARWAGAALAASGTLLLIAVPLLWRPAPGPPGPGPTDGLSLPLLALWLSIIWLVAAVLGWRTGRRRQPTPTITPRRRR